MVQKHTYMQNFFSIFQFNKETIKYAPKYQSNAQQVFRLQTILNQSTESVIIFLKLGALRRWSSSCDDPYPEDNSSSYSLWLSLCTILNIFWMGAYVGRLTQSLNNEGVISKKPKVTLPSIFNQNWLTCKQESLIQWLNSKQMPS